MTSTFAGLGTALSALIAQRQAIDVAGQNMANASTVGYTRQRAEVSSVAGTTVASRNSLNVNVGQGVAVTGITRLGDAFLDAKVYATTGSASFLTARADAYSTLETSLGEPGTTALSSQLSSMWAKWSDVANSPDSAATRSVLLEQSKVVADQVNSLYSAVGTQWTSTRSKLAGLVENVNAVASNVADLNARIAQVTNSGGNANELIDQRNTQVSQLSDLVGASVQNRPDGSVDVMVGGNVLVSGARTQQVQLAGAQSFADATGTASTPGKGVDLVWSDNPTLAVSMSGGQVAGMITVLAPVDGTGNGGTLTEAAARLDSLATDIASKVNALHTTGTDLNGNPGGAFFSVGSGPGAAATLKVAITDPNAVAVASGTNGSLDGTLADTIAQIGSASDGPSATWHATVVDLGVRSSTATQRATVADAAKTSAVQLQTAQTSVDTDEETINLEAAQRAYQGAARVLTTMDDMLDTLINKTGLVGR